MASSDSPTIRAPHPPRHRATCIYWRQCPPQQCLSALFFVFVGRLFLCVPITRPCADRNPLDCGSATGAFYLRSACACDDERSVPCPSQDANIVPAMPEITFVFGPNDSFFFDCPKTWKFHNIPPTLRQLFSASMGPEWRIAQPFCLALSPQLGTETEPVWYVGCRVLQGEEKILYSHTLFPSTYPTLSSWTQTIPHGARACFLTFGPGYSYFACAPGRGSVWAGIPSGLSDKVQKAWDTPCCAALGVGGAWFVLWPGGEFCWDFGGGYRGLDGVLKGVEMGSVEYLAISPYNSDHYFVAFRDRTVRYDFTGAPRDWMEQMNDVFAQWQSEIAQAQAGPQSNMRYGVQQPTLSTPTPAGMFSPSSPTVPLSQQPPHVPQVYAHYAPEPQPMAIEMPGSLPQGVMLEPPPTAVERPGSVNVKRKKFFSRIFD